MARIGIICGLLLCGLTILGMSLTTQKSYTQFVPMMFGIPMLFLGVVSLNPHRRREAVGIGIALTALGAVLGTGRLIGLGVKWFAGEELNPISLGLVLSMTAFCGSFIVIGGIWKKRRPQSKGKMPNPPVTEPISEDGAISEAGSVEVAKNPASSDKNPYQSPPILK